jgi:hypothetical protein
MMIQNCRQSFDEAIAGQIMRCLDHSAGKPITQFPDMPEHFAGIALEVLCAMNSSLTENSASVEISGNMDERL